MNNPYPKNHNFSYDIKTWSFEIKTVTTSNISINIPEGRLYYTSENRKELFETFSL